MPDSARNTQLDGLRGCAAVAVVVFHSILDRDPTLNERIIRPTFQEAQGLYDLVTKLVFMLVSGETAVVLFFVLSGAVLFESLRRRHAGPAATALGFSLRRLLRLYPTFFVCLTGCLAAFAVTGAFQNEARHFWPNAALVDFSLLGASWTLQIEFLAIPFVLIAFGGYRRFGVSGIVAVFALFMAVLWQPGVTAHLVTYRRFLLCFALGFLIPTPVGAEVARRLPGELWPVLLIAMLVTRNVLGLHWWSMYLVQVFAALFIAQLYHRPAGQLGNFLNSAIPQYLGRLSYSLYLCNVAFLILAAHVTQDFALARTHPLESGLLTAIPVLAASIATAHVVEIGLERPSIAWGRRLTAFSLGPQPATASSPGSPPLS